MITTVSCDLHEPGDIAAPSQRLKRKKIQRSLDFLSSKFVEVLKENLSEKNSVKPTELQAN